MSAMSDAGLLNQGDRNNATNQTPTEDSSRVGSGIESALFKWTKDLAPSCGHGVLLWEPHLELLYTEIEVENKILVIIGAFLKLNFLHEAS